jgi:hypothetical protein
MRPTRTFLAAMLGSMALIAFSAAAAQAEPFHLEWNYGFTDEGSQKKVVAINHETPVTMDGEITGTSFTIPDGGVNWPTQHLTKPIPSESETTVTGISGTFDSATGQMTLSGTFTFYSNNALTHKCKIGPVNLTLTTEATEPYVGERFTAGVGGEGSIATKWDSLPNPEPAEVGANCTLIQKLTEAPGGLWISHGMGRCQPEGCPCPLASDGCGCSPACPIKRPELRASVTGNKTVVGGKRARVRVKLENIGGAAAKDLKICIESKRLLKRRCKALSSLAAGEAARRVFFVKTHRVSRGRTYSLTVSATGAKSTSLKLRVKPARVRG